jgi:hypothetical protein
MVAHELRSKEIDADEQQNHMRIAQMTFDLLLPILAACKLAIVPRSNEQRFAQKLQMLHQFVAQGAILMRVAAEHPNLVDMRHSSVRTAPLYTLLRERP